METISTAAGQPSLRTRHFYRFFEAAIHRAFLRMFVALAAFGFATFFAGAFFGFFFAGRS